MVEQELSEHLYHFRALEAKWQSYWLEHKTFATTDDQTKPKFFVLDMFPYPSGSGLHVGHLLGYTASDIIARYKRMRGFNVLHPMGWDAFGLPAEQYALKTGTHPKITTETNVSHFRKQMRAAGLSYDWDREVNTTDPKYYKFTQWIFRKLYEKGLAYESTAPVNWCPALGTVLANEEVIDGKSEVGGHPVEKRPIRQWVLRITAYAERLLEDLDLLDWPESVKEMQRNWIGKSVGADIQFAIKDRQETLVVFSTRPDTLYGATFCVLAPEHPLLETIVPTSHKAQVQDYQKQALQKSDTDRMHKDPGKTGVFTGAYALHPLTGEALPLYVADYVIMHYGTGAIMAVPGHDERDHGFAKAYGLPIKQVVAPKSLEPLEVPITEKPYTLEGVAIASPLIEGLSTKEAAAKIAAHLEENGAGKKTITYRLRDWIFSRQRYWGEPFPLSHREDGSVYLIPEKDLPVLLPEMDDFSPTEDGQPPLAKAIGWREHEVVEDGKKVKLLRETNIMPQWAGSCWYYLRYIDPHNDFDPVNPKKESYWMPVDLYVGGVEHAVLHLLYARFWHKVLYDLGVVSTKEPFHRLVNQGMILGENNEKMSKSRGNVVNPDDVIKEWGADSLRLYEMFMGPLEAVKPWQSSGIAGVHRFLKRIFKWYRNEDGSPSAQVSALESTPRLVKKLHETIKQVTHDIDQMQFNTAIARMMECVNEFYKGGDLTRTDAEAFVLLLAPFAPHAAEELWQGLGHQESLAYVPWPSYSEDLIKHTEQVISISVNGKLRGTLTVQGQEPEADILTKAKLVPGVEKHIAGKEIVKQIYVPLKIINFVVK